MYALPTKTQDIDTVIETMHPMMLQWPREAKHLLMAMLDLRPKTILEIGTCAGGTAALMALSGASVTTVDLNIPGWINEVPIWEDPLYLSMLKPGWLPKVKFIQHNSLDDGLLELLEPRYDFVLIDGEHHDDAPYIDWRLYSPLADVVGVHDIKNWDRLSEVGHNYNPPRLWNDVRAKYHTTEECNVPSGGIGIAYRNKPK